MKGYEKAAHLVELQVQPNENGPGEAATSRDRDTTETRSVMHTKDTAPAVPLNTPNIVILITGSRHAQYEHWADLIASAIWEHTQGHPYELVHGDARGIDRIAATVASRSERNAPGRVIAAKVTAFPADWTAYGKGAGPRRNIQMRDYCETRKREGAKIVCLAFHEDLAASKGTRHMVNIIQAVGGVTLVVSDGKVQP